MLGKVQCIDDDDGDLRPCRRNVALSLRYPSFPVPIGPSAPLFFLLYSSPFTDRPTLIFPSTGAMPSSYRLDGMFVARLQDWRVYPRWITIGIASFVSLKAIIIHFCSCWADAMTICHA